MVDTKGACGRIPMGTATAAHKTSRMSVFEPSRRSGASLACLLLGVVALASATPAAAFPEPEPILERPTTISGIPQVGQTLTITPAVWSRAGEGRISAIDRCPDASPSSCKVIPGGTLNSGGRTYLVAPEDVGFMIRAWTQEMFLGWSLGSQSEPTAVVTPAPTTTPPTTPTPPPTSTPQATKPTNTALPKITGKAKLNRRLTVSTGTWRGAARITYKYQWKSCDKQARKCRAIPGATKTVLRISTKYRGRRLVVAVTASNVAGRTTVTSKATSVVTR